MVRASAPELYDSFERHETTPGHLDLRILYEALAAVDFSKDVLAQSPAARAVLGTSLVEWSDLVRF